MQKPSLKQSHTGKDPQDYSRVSGGRLWFLTVTLAAVIAVSLFGMLYYDAILKHNEYEVAATRNQTKSTTTSAVRGTIYDRNMNVLAMSTSVCDIFLDPVAMRENNEDEDQIVSKLSELLDLDKAFIRAQAADSENRYKMLARRVNMETASKVREFIRTENLTCIGIEDDTQRVYPQNALASQVLGFVNSYNEGTEGLEVEYDDSLKAVNGKSITTTGDKGTQMLYSYDKEYPAENGSDLILTVDDYVQGTLEEKMRSAIEQYDILNGGFGMVMDVNTGEILAMASLNGFDPNNYVEIYDTSTSEKLEEEYQEAEELDHDTQEYKDAITAYNNDVRDARLAQWRNRCVSDGYEPGSTFKLITLASALENGAVTLNDSFYCGGSIAIKGREEDDLLHCWKAAGHGMESTAQALQNSCNIAFADIGIRLGGDKLYDFIQAFGLMEKTDIDLPGESAGLFFSRGTLDDPNSNASLASVSFGQTFKITPIQLVRAISAVVNGGYLLQPYIVSEVRDANGTVTQKNERTVLRQVISRETSETMRSLMESVVTEGTASAAKVVGYRIGGKTGTSEKIDQYDQWGNLVEDKIVSFIGVAPINDPQYVCLVALDTPSTSTGLYISGGIMAAPVVRDVFTDILPYLNVPADYSEESAALVDVTVPYLTGMTKEEAEQHLQNVNLNCRFVGDGDTVTDQIAESGSLIPGESTVTVYMGVDKPDDKVSVPDVTGMSIENARTAIQNAGLYLKLKGAIGGGSSVSATDQSVDAGEAVPRGTVITVEFTDYSAQD